MKETLYFWLDFTTYLVMGILLAYLLRGMLLERSACKGKIPLASIIICLQFVLIRQIMAQADWAKQFMYGADMQMSSSRQSILPMAVSMLVTLFVGAVCYPGNRRKLLSLVTAFYAFLELVRFTFYSAATVSINKVVEYYNHQLLCEHMDLEKYQQILGKIEIVWNILLSLSIVLFLMQCVRWYKKSIRAGESMYHQHEAALLLIPALMGLVFGIMLRCILFYLPEHADGNAVGEMYNLIENYPELNIIIPCMALLCIASMLLSAKLFAKAAAEQEKRCQAEVCQKQMAELEAHVLDMESVNEKIRGMKHDMKNYMADIQALLARAGMGDAQAKQEISKYVVSMHRALESLDGKCRTGNPVTDVIIGRYLRQAEEKSVRFFCDFIYPKHLGIDVFDMSVILNNGLENAWEACVMQKNEKTYIEVSTSQKGKMFFIQIKNSFKGTLQWSGEFPVSEKNGNGHGLGLKNIKNCAEKYFGRVELQTTEGEFVLNVMLQGRMENN